MVDEKSCEHRYLTSYGNGWVCANRACGVGILSLAVPLPMPLVIEALRAVTEAPAAGVNVPHKPHVGDMLCNGEFCAAAGMNSPDGGQHGQGNR